jgi:tRNA A-37 threonylcarbamoyl transferase component Bud32
MADTVSSIRKELQARLGSGKYYAVRTATARGVFATSFCASSQAQRLIEQLDGIMASGSVIKNDVATSISRVTWSGQDVVVKRYNSRGPLHSFRHAIKGSRASRVWFYSHLLESIGIATPLPLGYVEVRGPRLAARSYAIARYVDGVSLHHFLRDGTVPTEQSRNVLGQIAGMMGTLARYRISHGDLKHSNILVSSNGPVLTDLDAMKVHRCPMSHRYSWRRDIARFTRSAAMDDLPAGIKEICRDVLAQTGEAVTQTERSYQRAAIGRWSLTVRVGVLPEDALGTFCGDQGVYSGDERVRRVSSSNFARVFTCQLPYAGVRHTVYIKHFLARSPLDVVKTLFRASRARRAFKAALLLRRNGFDSPEPLAVLEKCFGPFCITSILLTDAAAGTTSPSAYLRTPPVALSPAALTERRLLLRQAGRTIGRMHTKGIFHGDLRSDNILVQRTAQECRLHFIDNERTRQFRRIPERLRFKNLVQLNMNRDPLTRTDRLRFLLAYAREAGLSRSRIAELARRVSMRTMQRLESQDRRRPRAREKLHATD